jgi:zinc/manganese transport system substrate-binding protein
MILNRLSLPRRSSSAIGVAMAGLLIAGCGGRGDDEGDAGDRSSSDPELPTLVATTSIWADITSNVACAEAVDAIIPAGADPHTFEPSLRDREELEQAGVVIANGNHLEESLVDLLGTVAGEGVDVVEIAPHVDVLVHDEPDADDEHKAGGDPHIWQDPTRVAGALDVIADAVIATGRDATAVAQCTDAYRAELEALDAEIGETMAVVPAARRVLVTNHDAFAYFAQRYRFQIVGTVIPSMSTLGESSAGQLADLADAIEANDVPAIFTEELASAADAEALASRLDVAVIALTSDSLAPDGPAATYVGMLRTNAETIANALAG